MKNGMITDGYGNKIWYLNGKKHRENGPTCEYADGHKEWWVNGKRHREDGPAIEYTSGDKEWYLNGILVSKEEVLNTSEKIEAYVLMATLEAL